MKYIFLSALLFLIPDFFPWLSIPCTFIFLMPLFITPSPVFFKGFIWGLVVCSVKCFWFLMLVTTNGCESISSIAGIFLWVGVMVWMAFFSGVWFWAITKSLRIGVKLLLTFFYFYFMTFGCMFPFGVFEGYPFFNPLVPLAKYPAMLWGMQHVGFVGTLIFLILFQLLMAQWIDKSLDTIFSQSLKITREQRRNVLFFFRRCSRVFFMYPVHEESIEGYKKNHKHLFFAFLCLLPFLLGPFFYQTPKMPVHGIHYIQPWWYGCKNPAFVGHKMADEITSIVEKFPHASCILMPESTFCFELDDYQDLVSLWSRSAQDAVVLFGGHRRVRGRVGNVVLNSFFVLQGSKIQHVYDKQHLMPFVERGVKWFDCGSSENQHCANDLVCLCCCGQTYQIFMCSELFFEAKKVKGYPIILIANESWLYCDYMKKLAVLFIQYFELKYNQPVLYATTQGRSNVKRPSHFL